MSSESHEPLAPQETARAGSDRCSARSPAPSSSPPGIASPLASGDGKWTHIWSSWKWELLPCVLVLATPLIMLATLYPHAEQPLPNWPFKITINTLLSIYNVVFKTSIGFLAASAIGQLQWTWFASRRPLYDVVRLDAAGRGAWGSCVWICTNHFKQPLITLGASILILSMALDPFIQQIIHPVDCMSSSGRLEQATLPRTNFFVPEGPDDGVLDLGITAGLGDSLRNAVAYHSSGVEANCPTGNCTFPRVFGTMGFCSSCKDSSSEISFETVCLANGNENETNTTYKIENPTNFNECSNKSGLYFDTQCFVLSDSFRSYGAATCSLYPCVRMYNAAVENGQLKERLVAHSDDQQLAVRVWGSSAYGSLPGGNGDSMITTLDTECLSAKETDILLSFTGDEVPLSIFDAGRVTFERIDTLFSNISNALTIHIRTHGNKTYSVDAAGDVWHASTCLEVQWPWIAFHTTLAVLTLLLFVLVLIASHQQPVWKASPLVWILRGPTNENAITSGFSTLDKMEEESKR
ncbi:hypothetical protein PG997_015390 [Apiospora hydei]|uniref:Uncharacterized protein n=1 Tax=Apiospora hydei TaxID=1337664 RepID=A0ABR1UQH5_9PEZI